VAFTAPSQHGAGRRFDYGITVASITHRREEPFRREDSYAGGLLTFQATPAAASPVAGTRAIRRCWGRFNHNPGKITDAVFATGDDFSSAADGAASPRLNAIARTRRFAEVSSTPWPISATEIDFIGRRGPRSRNISRTGDCRLGVDTFPSAGATSTFEEVWMACRW